MGFYIRKSISVGPFRFNLSKSGVGVSTGIKGFRVGTGPRGNYVQMGRGGIYFRQTLPNAKPSTSHNLPPKLQEEEPSQITFEEIESGDVNLMVDSSSSALLEEVNSKAKKPLFWPWVVGAGVGLLLLGAIAQFPIWFFCLVMPLFVGCLFLALRADKLRKTVVLFYSLEPHIEEAYQQLHNAFDSIRSCSRAWHIDSKGDIHTTYDWKVNAGADSLVRRNGINLNCSSPPYFLSNVSIPALPAKRRTLYFLPDRILIWGTDGVGAAAYEQLVVNFQDEQFIESSYVPPDSRVVDKTWRYVNKNGGPDRRFKDNREIPIAMYGGLLLTSQTGLRERYQFSRTGQGKIVKTAVDKMVSAFLVREEAAPSNDFTKCPCNNCEVFIEFPCYGVGETVVCPHCGMETKLFKPAPAAQ